MATVFMDPSLELEDIWEELVAEPQHLFAIDDESSSDLEGSTDLQAEALYNKAAVLEFDDCGNFDGANNNLFSEDMLDLLSLQRYPSCPTNDVASALESVLHDAIVMYADKKDVPSNNNRPTRSNNKRKTAQETNQSVLYPQAIAEFWDGWISGVDNSMDTQYASPLDLEIFSIEEELTKIQGQITANKPAIGTTTTKQLTKALNVVNANTIKSVNSPVTISPSQVQVNSPSSLNSTPSGSPITTPPQSTEQASSSPSAPITIEISDEEDNAVTLKKRTTLSKSSSGISSKKRPTTSKSPTTLPIVTTSSGVANSQQQQQGPKRRKMTSSNGSLPLASSSHNNRNNSNQVVMMVVQQSDQHVKSRNNQGTSSNVNVKSTKRKLFKNNHHHTSSSSSTISNHMIEEVFKVEQVLKIKRSDDDDNEDELVDIIGDASDYVHN